MTGTEIFILIGFIILGLIFLTGIILIIICLQQKGEAETLMKKIEDKIARLEKIKQYLTYIEGLCREAELDEEIFDKCVDATEYNLAIKEPRRFLTQQQFEDLRNFDYQKVCEEIEKIKAE